MKKYSQLQKGISMLLINILLIQISGCVTSNITTSGSDIPVTGNYYYIIHSQKPDYLLENIVISNGILSGNIYGGEYYLAVNKVHVYLSSDTLVEINSDMILNIPLDYITKVKIVNIETKKTILLILGIALPLFVLPVWRINLFRF